MLVPAANGSPGSRPVLGRIAPDRCAIRSVRASMVPSKGDVRHTELSGPEAGCDPNSPP